MVYIQRVKKTRENIEMKNKIKELRESTGMNRAIEV